MSFSPSLPANIHSSFLLPLILKTGCSFWERFCFSVDVLILKDYSETWSQPKPPFSHPPFFSLQPVLLCLTLTLLSRHLKESEGVNVSLFNVTLKFCFLGKEKLCVCVKCLFCTFFKKKKANKKPKLLHMEGF